MFNTLLFTIALAFSTVAAAGPSFDEVNSSKSYSDYIRILDEALSFDETVDHEFLDAVKERKKYYDSGSIVTCKVAILGDLALDFFEKSVLNMSSDWLTTPQRESMEAYFSADQFFDICTVEDVAPKSDDFYQATVVFIVRYTKDGMNSLSALRLDWFDGDVIDEP